MKTLALTAFFALSGLSAQAANIAIKNDTGAPQKLVIYQNGKLVGYVNGLKRGKTLLVKVDDEGSKPVLVLTVGGEDKFLFLPLKSKAYRLSWLKDIFW